MIPKLLLTLFLLLIFLPAATALTITRDFGDITVTYPAADSLIVLDMIRTFSGGINEFQRKLGQYPDLPVKIVVLDETEAYLKSARTSSAIIEFSRAFYHRREGTIYLRDPKDQRNFVQLHTILLHEYIHHFVNRYWPNLPLWFNEGMAVYFSNDLSLDREINFVKNYILGNSLELEEMKYGYPENRIEWESFYAKSALAVKYLFQNNYQEFLNLWEFGARGVSFNRAFLRAFFMTPADFSLLFEEYSKKHFTTEILLASTSLIWGILPLILIIGWIRKKIKAARIKKSWDKEEAAIIEFPDEVEIEEDDKSERI